MASTAFDFEVITPEGHAFRGRVTALRLPGRKGNFGVLARHAPLVGALDAGVLRAKGEDGKEKAFAIGEGFVEVRRGGVRALVDFCNAKGKVDHARAEAALKRALARLSTSRLTGLD